MLQYNILTNKALYYEKNCDSNCLSKFGQRVLFV